MARPLKIALPVLVLAGAFAVAGILAATRERTEARPVVERVWPIETAAARFEDIRPMLRFYGEIAAGREIELRAPAAGPVVRVAEAFADGAAASAGTELLAVDPFDYEQALAERKAARDEARAQLAETRARLSGERELLAEDDEQVAIGARDVARRESLVGAAVSERGLDEARMTLSQARSRRIQRQRDIDVLAARIAQGEAAVARLEAALARAARALEDTVLRAPFDGWIADPAAQLGERLREGDRVARLIGSAVLEARFHLPDAAFGRSLQESLGRDATVVWRLGPRTERFAATVTRIDGEVDPGTGGVAAYARLLADDSAAFAALRPGAFVEVLAPDRLYRRVARLPAAALHGDRVYAVVDGRLEAREVDAVARDGATVLVAGALEEGDEVAITRLTEIGPGLKVVAQ